MMSPTRSEQAPPTPSLLTPPLSERASMSDAETPKIQAPKLKAKVARMSLSSMRSSPELQSSEKKNTRRTFHGFMHRRRHSGQEASSVDELPIGFMPDVEADEKPNLPPSPLPSSNPANTTHRPKGWRSKSRPKWPSQGTKAPIEEIAALEGEAIASRLKLGTASIDGEFHKIEYGRFKNRPACLITVDLRLAYQPESTINKAKIEFQFGPLPPLPSDLSETPTPPTTKPPISKLFAPVELEGIAELSKDTQHQRWEPELSAFSVKTKVGGGGSHKTLTNKHRWRVQGQTEDHANVYDTFGWRIVENTVSEDSVPRRVRLGMIAFHEHRRFWVDVSVEGGVRKTLRGKTWTEKAVRERRWFEPPSEEEVGGRVLQQERLDFLVGRQNLEIVDVAPSRKVEQQIVNLIDVSGMGEGGGVAGAGAGFIGSVGQDLASLYSVGEDVVPFNP